MADGPFRLQQGTGQFFYPQYNQQNHRNLPQRVQSPVNSAGRIGFNTETPSPSRSPAASSPAHHFFNMFNQNRQQHNQHSFLNGGAGNQHFNLPMISKHFHQANQNQNQHHHDHAATHGGAFGQHQHTMSSGGLANAVPHFNANHLQNGTPNNAGANVNKPPTEHWAEQLRLCQEVRGMNMAHAYARTVATANKGVVTPSTNGFTKEADKEERHRATVDAMEENDKEVWTQLDFGGQNLKTLAPPLFQYDFLTKLFLNHNKFTTVPASIRKLRQLNVLDLSCNQLVELPAEIGMLSMLQRLLLFDNRLHTLPSELGFLYQLEMLGIEGNPLQHGLKEIIMESGSRDLIRHLREEADPPPAPAERDWVVLDESSIPDQDKFSVLSYNTLCDRYATATAYGYTPSQVLSWDSRRQVILDELRARNADVMCLQEVDQESFADFFRANLAHDDYKGIFWPKGRAKTMGEREMKAVDGCAIFYKNSKYILLDKQLVDYRNIAINKPDMKGEHDIFNRVMTRDDIAVIAFFENRQTGSRLIVANTHLFWDPKFNDVKLVQVAILMEQVAKHAEKYTKWPPCTDKALYKYANGDDVNGEEEEVEEPVAAPSQSYGERNDIPLVVCGDYNSLPGSGVCELISKGTLSHDHTDLNNRRYGDFTRLGMAHPFNLKSSYSAIGELPWTNYTPPFTGVIDYIWYSTNALNVTGLLGQLDEDYVSRVPGFPNYHFPSDHLALLAEFSVKGRREKRMVEADFGPSRDRRSAGGR